METSPHYAPPANRFLGLGLSRSTNRRVIAGVAGGLAERLRVEPALVRVAFVLLALCGGAGVLAYTVLWVSVPQAETPVEALDAGPQRGVAVALVTGGLVIALRSMGLWVGDTIAWSVGLVAIGITVVWLRGDDTERARWSRLAQQAPASMLDAVAERGPVKGIGRVRLLIGLAAGFGGLAIFLARSHLLATQPGIVAAVGVTAVGVGLIAGPWGWRLVQALGDERRERIRSEERAEVAAHLHDSVLQTLALIQRTDQPREMVALARNQERELRAWLSGRPSLVSGEKDTVATAIEKAAASVELQFKVPVEVVTVGDAALDDRLQAIVDATREATVNAAKHSGAEQISIYLEVEPESVTAFVRDQGTGFDPDSVAPDRRGIADSIRGRMQRSGGSATIVTELDAGTEVQLSIPRVA
jgi:signal transduction histidine kinase/phage shock protein PspC (stress-responsive transcriptional regulator)